MKLPLFVLDFLFGDLREREGGDNDSIQIRNNDIVLRGYNFQKKYVFISREDKRLIPLSLYNKGKLL